MALKEAAIAKVTPPGITTAGRYQPTDAVLAFLAALWIMPTFLPRPPPETWHRRPTSA